MATQQQKSDLTKVTPPTELTEAERATMFEHISCRLAAHRNKAEMYAQFESHLADGNDSEKLQVRQAHDAEINRWAQALLENAWAACQEPGGSECIPVVFTEDVLLSLNFFGCRILSDSRTSV